MTGSAETSSATPVAGVAVAFKLAADLGSCGTCGLHSAVTDTAGTYSLTLPAGVYDALCAKTGQTCQVMMNPPVATAKVTVLQEWQPQLPGQRAHAASAAAAAGSAAHGAAAGRRRHHRKRPHVLREWPAGRQPGHNLRRRRLRQLRLPAARDDRSRRLLFDNSQRWHLPGPV